LARAAEGRGLACHLVDRDELDIADAASILRALDRLCPWAVINCAGYVRVDEAELEPERCWRENAIGPTLLADSCARRGIRVATFSSDLVFSRVQDGPYVESDPPEPLSVYGSSKAEAERAVLESMPDALVIRTAAFFAPSNPFNFVSKVARSLRSGVAVRVAVDQIISPTYVPELADAVLDLLLDGESGLWHLANRGALSWAQLALRVAEATGMDARLIQACRSEELGLRARRPARSCLASERGSLLGSLDDALAAYFRAERARDARRA
jgi:dTDP-4-dehydrorhamnose reductase